VAVHVVEAEGMKYGRTASVRVEAVTQPHDRWGLGGNVVSTGAPAAEAARLLLRGSLNARGVLPPERVLEPAAFLAALTRTGCQVTAEGP
jgi:saccharopine dehydrogenase-like NADP-dependent oxidoreductase